MGNLFSRKDSVRLSFEQSILRLNFKLFQLLDKNVNQCLQSLTLHQLFCVLSEMPLRSRGRRRVCDILDIPCSSEATQYMKNRWHEFMIYNNTKNGPLKIRLGLLNSENVSDDIHRLIEADFLGRVIPSYSEDKNLLTDLENWLNEFTEIQALNTLHQNLTESCMKTTKLFSTLLFALEWNSLLNWITIPDDMFFTGGNEYVKTDMLFEHTRLAYYNDKSRSVQVLKIPYSDPAYYILFVLPKDLNRLETELVKHPELIQNWMQNLISTFIAVYLPKFEIENEINISKLFQITGSSSFSLSWPRSSRKENALSLNSMKQTNRIIISEGTKKGKIASSLNVTRRVKLSKSLIFKINKPCLYFIYRDDFPLCMGRLINPNS